jgi:hypothetical protein
VFTTPDHASARADQVRAVPATGRRRRRLCDGIHTGRKADDTQELATRKVFSFMVPIMGGYCEGPNRQFD